MQFPSSGVAVKSLSRAGQSRLNCGRKTHLLSQTLYHCPIKFSRDRCNPRRDVCLCSPDRFIARARWRMLNNSRFSFAFPRSVLIIMWMVRAREGRVAFTPRGKYPQILGRAKGYPSDENIVKRFITDINSERERERSSRLALNVSAPALAPARGAGTKVLPRKWEAHIERCPPLPLSH